LLEVSSLEEVNSLDDENQEEEFDKEVTRLEELFPQEIRLNSNKEVKNNFCFFIYPPTLFFVN
jgi:hypothetical protein